MIKDASFFNDNEFSLHFWQKLVFEVSKFYMSMTKHVSRMNNLISWFNLTPLFLVAYLTIKIVAEIAAVFYTE